MCNGRASVTKIMIRSRNQAVKGPRPGLQDQARPGQAAALPLMHSKRHQLQA